MRGIARDIKLVIELSFTLKILVLVSDLPPIEATSAKAPPQIPSDQTYSTYNQESFPPCSEAYSNDLYPRNTTGRRLR